jgi:hypothetical protein
MKPTPQVKYHNDIRMLVLKRRFLERVILNKNKILNDIDIQNIIYEKDIIKSISINNHLTVLHDELVLVNKFIRNYD